MLTELSEFASAKFHLSCKPASVQAEIFFQALISKLCITTMINDVFITYIVNFCKKSLFTSVEILPQVVKKAHGTLSSNTIESKLGWLNSLKNTIKTHHKK